MNCHLFVGIQKLNLMYIHSCGKIEEAKFIFLTLVLYFGKTTHSVWMKINTFFQFFKFIFKVLADLNNHNIKLSIFVAYLFFIHLVYPCIHVTLILININFYYQISKYMYWCNLLLYKYKLRRICNNIVFVIQHVWRGELSFHNLCRIPL